MSDSDFISGRLQSVKRIVIKVGTHLLRGSHEGLNLDLMDSLAAQISELRRRGISVILVSSGAVGAGAFVMGFSEPPKATEERQALAAIGQSRLMHHYEATFRKQGIHVAQVLLTRDSFDDRQRYLNARNTFETLLAWDVLPIVNENDTVAIEELKFGDNDQLSALMAGKIGADLLVMLTDVEGLYDRAPSEPGARRIVLLPRKKLLNLRIGTGKGSAFGLGGMRSKLEAARAAGQAGILVNVSCGATADILLRILAGDRVGTWVEPENRRISARKQWIAYGKRMGSGRIRVDQGAEAALCQRGKSLLPSGVIEVMGEFGEGELVSVSGPKLQELARGLTQYSSDQLRAIQGKRTAEIAALLGQRQNYVVVHRDDMVILDRDCENG